ncbi:uncharacterized protein LOC129604427 [Betta splendens]|uniref:Uncharacterized protein LOC129604427 n=1 Tax=Betta splendens TaxID=158456 RepID=A0A9W2XXZ1_BETSP|nr:uncharacterized protein LOC129604427 [Betta splendens]
MFMLSLQFSLCPFHHFRMALHGILGAKPEFPNYKPPPLHIYVVAVQDQPKVLSWDFSSSDAKPGRKINNKIVILSDGQTVTKMTVYENQACKFIPGSSYILRGYILKGESPPYHLTLTRDTQVFRGASITINDVLIKEGEALLQPTSVLTPLAEVSGQRDFMTIKGEVIEVSSVKKVLFGKEAIPLRNLTLRKDKIRASICLWQEASMADIQLGSHMRISHLKGKHSGYGLQLQSTNYTTLEEINTSEENADDVVGVMDSETPGFVNLLLAVVSIDHSKWDPFEVQLSNGPVRVMYKRSGNVITDIYSL